VIKETSIPHDGQVGGDTHVHAYEEGATVTDRFKNDVEVHTNFDEEGNFEGTQVKAGEKVVELKGDDEPNLNGSRLDQIKEGFGKVVDAGKEALHKGYEILEPMKEDVTKHADKIAAAGAFISVAKPEFGAAVTGIAAVSLFTEQKKGNK
jgi:hypothetical protein